MDYEKAGLKCGIEIHRQLDTAYKLFCECRPRLSESAYMQFRRRLRPVTGELGEMDVAAVHEFLKSQEFTYSVYPEETCLVEADCEPPHEVSMEALEIVIRIASLLNCEIPDEIHVMRKTVIDGSNTSGFQRTAIVGVNGWLETSFGRVGIDNVSVEEESSQILGKEKGSVHYGLDRLGIPLVEIGTAPDIRTAEQAKEVAQKIGMMLKSTGRVKPGLGTIRQDLNVSIAGGSRVEIKGVQDLAMILRMVDAEIMRQKRMIAGGEKVPREVRKALPDGTTEFLRPMPGAARLYPETDIPPIRVTKELLDRVRSEKTELIEDKIEVLKKLGLSKDLAAAVANSKEYYDIFSRLSGFRNVKPAFMAETIVSYGPEILKKHKGADPSRISESHLEEVFRKLDEGRIPKESVMELLAEVARGGRLDFSKHELDKDIDLEKEVEHLIKEKPDLSFGALMGLLMKKHRGKVSGEQISRILKEKMGK